MKRLPVCPPLGGVTDSYMNWLIKSLNKSAWGSVGECIRGLVKMVSMFSGFEPCARETDTWLNFSHFVVTCSSIWSGFNFDWNLEDIVWNANGGGREIAFGKENKKRKCWKEMGHWIRTWSSLRESWKLKCLQQDVEACFGTRVTFPSIFYLFEAFLMLRLLTGMCLESILKHFDFVKIYIFLKAEFVGDSVSLWKFRLSALFIIQFPRERTQELWNLYVLKDIFEV